MGNVLTTSLTGLHPSTAYTVAVHAKDPGGKTGPASSASFTSSVDNTPPSAPGAITVSNILWNSATATWGAATDNVAVTSYEYQLNGGTWVNVGNVLTKSITGLAASTSYTIAVHAKDAAGNIGPAVTKAFSTPTVTDTPVMTQGDVEIGPRGFIAGDIGSMNPATTSNGYVYNEFADTEQPHGGGYVYTRFGVSGFSTDPGISWLTSAKAGSTTLIGSAATYVFSAGTATWTWTNGWVFTGSGTIACTIIHK